jgi:MscS family membrane protein
MNWRFQWFYRVSLAVLFISVCWSVWAQTVATNSVPAAAAKREIPPTNSTTAEAVADFCKEHLPASVLSFANQHLSFLVHQTFFGQPLWKYPASLLFIALAFGVARLLNYIANHWLKRLAARTQTKYDDLILELVRGPVEVVAFVIFLHIGLSIFDWPPSAQIFFAHALIIVVACSITFVALKVVDLLLGLWREKVVSPQDKVFANQLIPLISKSAKIAIVVAAALLTAENLNWEIKSLLAGLSVGGLALGLAAQDTVANLFGAVAVFLDKPFYVGDRIKVENTEGAVELIGLRSTRIRSLDGYLVTVPNKMMGNAIITNLSRRPSIRTEMNFGLPYDTTTEQVKRATVLLEEIFRANPKTLDLLISFNKFTDSTLNILVTHVWNGTDSKVYFAEMQEMNLQIKRRFEAEKIEFAFPTQALHIKTATGK